MDQLGGGRSHKDPARRGPFRPLFLAIEICSICVLAEHEEAKLLPARLEGLEEYTGVRSGSSSCGDQPAWLAHYSVYFLALVEPLVAAHIDIHRGHTPRYGAELEL